LLVSHQVTIRVGDGEAVTLEDIVPARGPMKMLMIGKRPASVSVEAGHYFQGQQGRMFWNRMTEYELLDVPPESFEDDVLLTHGYGLTDIVKAPGQYGDEPSDAEYREGLERILELVARLEPQVLLYVYMPGTPCTTAQAIHAMTDLRAELQLDSSRLERGE
jgi:G:T/U-mismatch repair DNA glycosylase